MANHNDLGTWGEQIALKHLQEKGYHIIERNWQCGKWEVDIIARQGEELVMVEVKTRNFSDLDPPEAAVTRQKQKFLIWAAQMYIEKYDLDCETRFDIIAISVRGQGYELNHMEEAFYPTL